MLIYLLITTYPDLENAKQVSTFVVKEKLAACAQISDSIISFYHWNNALQEDHEYRVVFKTSLKKLEALTHYIHSHHPYQVPQLIMIPGHSHESYAEWLYRYLS